jgi:hypothetical protein
MELYPQRCGRSAFSRVSTTATLGEILLLISVTLRTMKTSSEALPDLVQVLFFNRGGRIWSDAQQLS